MRQTRRSSICINAAIVIYDSAAMNYNQYIQSPAWKKLREAAISRDGGRCQTCHAMTNLEVHHCVYPRKKGGVTQWEEDCLDNLTTLCKNCHDPITSELRKRRYKKRKISATPTPEIGRRTPLVKPERRVISATPTPESRRKTPWAKLEKRTIVPTPTPEIRKGAKCESK